MITWSTIQYCEIEQIKNILLSMTVDLFTLQIPFRGVIAAGWPSPAEEELGDMLTFEEWLVPHKASSCLVTVGTSALKSEGILPDDIAIMERGRTPQHGDIVIAEIDGTPIIRKFEKVHSLPQLVSDNGTMNLSEESDVRILGVVASVIRRYR